MKTPIHAKHLLFLTVLGAMPSTYAQDPFADPDPFAGVKYEAPTEATRVSLYFEVFSMPLQMAATLRRESLSDVELYNRLVEKLGTSEVTQDIFTQLTTLSGRKSTSEAVTEHIFPTTYEAADKPASAGKGAAVAATGKEDPSLAVTPALVPVGGLHPQTTPIAFETRKLGLTLDAEVTLGEDKNVADIGFIIDRVSLGGQSNYGQGSSEVTQPEFEVSRLEFDTTVAVGSPSLLGTLNRPANSKVDPDSANRVSYAFVTLIPVKIKL